MSEGMRLAAIGLVIGLVTSIAVGRAIRAMLVGVGEMHVSEFGARFEHSSDERDVASFYRFDESPDRDAVDVGLEFGPAIEAVVTGDGELRRGQDEAIRYRREPHQRRSEGCS